LVGDSAFIVATHIVGLAVTLLLTPIQLSRMGYERYGLLALMVAIVGIFGFLDYGLSWGVLRYVPALRARSEDSAASEAASLFFLAGVSVAAIVGICGSAVLVSGVALGAPAIVRGDREAIIACAITVAMASMVFNVLSNIARAVGAFRKTALVYGLYFVSTNIVWAAVGGYRFDVELVLIWQALYLAGGAAYWWWRIPTLGLRGIGMSAGVIRGTRARPMLRFAGWSALAGLSTGLFSSADRPAFATALPLSTLPLYTIPAALATRIGLVASAVTPVTFPQLSAAHAADERSAFSSLSISALRGTAVCTTAVAAPLFWAGPAFLELWISPGFADDATVTIRVLAVAWAAEAFGQLGYIANDARGRVRRSMASGITCAIIALIGAAAGAAAFGLSGGAALFAIALTVHGLVGIVFGFGLPRLPAISAAASVILPSVLAVGLAVIAAEQLVDAPFITLTAAVISSLSVFLFQVRRVIALAVPRRQRAFARQRVR
jgi:O-antigen/teichoic acid export membrane protein